MAAMRQPVLDSAPETKIGIDHLDWLDDIRPKVNVPVVDPSVQHREIRVTTTFVKGRLAATSCTTRLRI